MIFNSSARKFAILCAPLALCSPMVSRTAAAAPTKLDCVLTHAGPDGKDVSRAITVVFDSGANTLVVVDGEEKFDLAHVKISTISINGYNDAISIGIERSSWAIVLQTYSQNPPTAEFGQCRLPAASSN